MTEAKQEPAYQSPFLPNTRIQFAWDSTSLGMLKTCPRLYQYQMILGYTTEEENYHLRFGIEFHKTLEGYDKERALGAKPKEAYRNTIFALMSRIWNWNVDLDSKAGNYKNKHTLISLCVDYLDKFSDDPAKTYIKADGKPAVELSFRFELDWGPKATEGWIGGKCEKCSGHGLRPNADGEEMACPDCGGTGDAFGFSQPYLLCGHLDRVVSFSDNLFVMDRKTSKTTLSEYYFDQYAPNNQMTLYTLAGQLVLNSPIRGVIIDGAQILLEKPNAFKRGMTYRTQDQLDEWLGDLRYWLSLAETFAERNYWPMNDTACDKFGGCRFREVCSKSPSVRNMYLKSNFVQQAPEDRWNPLRER
jgi:hypothetical protein